MASSYGLTQFEHDPELDLKAYSVWICDRVHYIRPWRPLVAWLWCEGATHGIQYGAEVNSMPETKGWQLKIIDGYVYLAVIEPKPEEVPEREKVFREKMRPILDNYDALWAKAMADWNAVENYFEGFDYEGATDIQIYEHYEDYLVRHERAWWAIHMLWMYPVYGLYNLFVDVCGEMLGIDLEDLLFKRLMSGFDNMLFRVNKAFWVLGERAQELGLADLFLTTTDNEQLLRKLEESDAGRKWLQEYREFLNVHGWRCEDTWDSSTPTFLERPSLGLRDIKYGIAKGGAFVLDVERERLAKDREEAEREILARVPIEQKEWFEKLMKVAEKSGSFSEEHNYYIDYPAFGIARRMNLEYGRRLTKAGVIDDPEDIFFLFPCEVRRAAIARERENLRPYVNRRREEWERNCQVTPALFLGAMEKLPDVSRKDPIIRVMAGAPRVKPELKADLYGSASAPGVVEGVARVVMTDKELHTVQPGEILVAPITGPPWTPIFGIVSGVVCNAGGSLSHPVIVSREYGIPAVIGTMEATQKIKTGDRIRVDGDMGAVYILK
jgi:pyruvate,water dikinase